ncbi:MULTISPECIES: hypothetical protein [Paraburkholderia]|uniref:Uncharacterized protein n=1 Tax=Paraburkholderia madseniana TaxID=2599607 RepID=A0AAP5BD48_9BURK|nr:MULTISPECIES: hypothetical protein [Paraburkholderia]MCX4146426.1 hypothetical protein [Paraburkholderia madseniana]MDN7149372.1 hypothetical protein [Paraburkholderia sp. WS6]MDQ6408252.1 hypothetical protein [Paraburkholderia madseniana]
MKSRTPSDSAIVAIFRDKRKPQNAVRSAFPLDFMGIFQRYGGTPRLLQGGLRRLEPAPDKQGRGNSAPTYAHAAVLCIR